jgi:hypothetical protein
MAGIRRKFEKLDKRSQARLDAAVVECAERGTKQSCRVLIDQLAQAGIVVEVRHVDNSTHRLGYNWRDVFLPVSREDRGYPNKKQPETDSTDGDISERLRSIQVTMAGLSNAIGELRLSQHAIQQHIAAERQLAKDRAASIRADMQKLFNRTINCENKLENVTRILSVVRLSQERFPTVSAVTSEPQREEIE